MRGIQIGLESSETTYGQVGPLRSVKLRWFKASSVLGDGDEAEEGHSGWKDLPESRKQGLWLQIRHENASYVALLLPGVEASDEDASRWQMAPGKGQQMQADQDQFLQLPLLLFRMPAALKNVISEWLCSTFDCRVSKLALGTKTILSIWEDWIRRIGLPTTGPDFQILLAFNVPLSDAAEEQGSESESMNKTDASGLKSLDITIRARDLRRFVRAGKNIQTETSTNSWDSDPRERRRLAGSNDDDGWAWRAEGGNDTQSPFTEALGAYLNHHLALNLFHPSVHVVQVSCSGFVLAQSRVKIVRPSDGLSEEMSKAAWMFVARLGERISGNALPTVFR